MKPVILLLVAALATLVTVTAASSEKRVALVIGNGDYENTQILQNPVNDAVLLTAALGRVGFEVISVSDGSRQSMLGALREFGRSAEGADVALFFYAGHGLEVAGRNWLLPVNANIETSSDLPVNAVRVDDVLEVMELSQARMRVVILDACRNNPLPRSITRSLGRGLAKIETSAAGTMVVFAAAPGKVALDGGGANSPFSAALAAHIDRPGVEIRQMIGRVRADVMAATNDRQVPWVNEAIVGDYYLAGQDTTSDDGNASASDRRPVRAGVASADDVSIELEFWKTVKDSQNKQLLDAYLKEYPQGAFRKLAETMIAALDAPVQQQRAAEPQPPKSQTTPAPQQNQLAALQADMEMRARRFVFAFNEASSADLDRALSFVDSAYSHSVDFYGKRFSRREVRKDKERLFKRWPQRRYEARDSQISLFCNPASARCQVDYVVYWNVYSPRRDQSANGVQRTNLVLDFATGQPQIVLENGENITP